MLFITYELFKFFFYQLTGIQTQSPIFYFGESIDLNCTLDPGGSHQVFSESKLYFKSSTLKKDQDFRILYGTPLDNSAHPGIAIHDMVNQTASKENKYMHYLCYYDSCIVDEILVEIECKLLYLPTFFTSYTLLPKKGTINIQTSTPPYSLYLTGLGPQF